MLHLATVYCGLIFIAVVGVLQAAASHNNLKGLLFFRKKGTGYFFGALALGFSLFTFFIWNSRYATGVIEGSQQAGLFALSTGAAVLFTFVLSSLIKNAALRDIGPFQTGLAFFRKATWFSFIRQKLASKRL